MKFLLSFLLLLSVCTFSLKATEYIVNPQMSTGEIQKQINNAQTNDVIRFSRGTYNLNGSISIIKSIVLEGVKGDSSAVTLKVSGNFRHIKANSGKVQIKYLTFDGSNNNAFGGGIEYVGQDSLIINNSEFRFNKNQEGGAIYSFGNLLLTNCFLSSNTAITNGGAVYIRGKAFFIGCFFNENKSVTLGGAIYNQSRSKTRIEAVNLSNSVFVKNQSDQGGAICADNPVEADACVFISNIAGNYGGGAIFTTNSAVLSESVFHNNSSIGKGGGVFAQRLMKIADCVFSSNKSNDVGGGIYNVQNESSIEEVSIIKSSVFSKNESKSGGAIYSSLSNVVLDSYFEQNVSQGSGGGIYCDKNILLNRTCFDSNIAASEGGAVDAETARIINTTMVNNKAQNASAIHATENLAIVLSSLSGNQSSLKSGSTIYGKVVSLYGSIIAGNIEQDKVTGKIKSNENNIIGSSSKSSLRDIFQDATTNGSVVLSIKPGVIPFLLLKNMGAASGKIPAGRLVTWENELGISDLFNTDQLKNKRIFASASDLGAALYNTSAVTDPKQIPVVNIQSLMADVNARKLTTKQRSDAQDVIQQVTAVSTTQRAQPGASKQTVKKAATTASQKFNQNSMEDDLDRIVEAVILGTFDDYADLNPKTSQVTKAPDKKTRDDKPSTTKPTVTNTSANTEKPVQRAETTKLSSQTPISSGSALSGDYTINSKNPTGNRNFASIEEAVNTLNSYGNSQKTQFIIAPDTYITDRPITISNAKFPLVFTVNENATEKAVIRSGGNNRSIVIAVNTPITMERLVFEGPGAGIDSKIALNGGGISCNTDALLTFSECIFRYNKTQTGSSIFARKVLVSQCAFYDNIASDGAGIFATECTAVNSTFYANKAGVGSGIYAKDAATIVFCTFTQNEATNRGAAVASPNINLYGNIIVGNKSGAKDKDIDGNILANFSNVLGGAAYNVFAEADAKDNVKFNFDLGSTPVVTIKPGGMAAEQISESLLKQWEDELNLDRLLSVDQLGKRRPQNRNAEAGAWEIPDKRSY